MSGGTPPACSGPSKRAWFHKPLQTIPKSQLIVMRPTRAATSNAKQARHASSFMREKLNRHVPTLKKTHGVEVCR